MGKKGRLAKMKDIHFKSEPQKREGKPEFDDLPAALIEKIESLIGDKIIKSEMAWGGYSASFSILADTEQQGRFFIKGSHPEETAHGFKMLEQEITAYQNIDILKSISPEYIGYVSLGGEDDWHLGIWRAVPNGYIKTALQDQDLRLIAARLKFIYQNFNPESHDIHAAEDTNFIQNILSGKMGWEKFDGNIDRIENFTKGFEDEAAARSWLDKNLQNLIDLSLQKADQHMRTLLHFDLRTDNMLFDDKGQVWFIDWPNACVGPAVYDLVYLVGELSLRGNGSCADIYQKLIDYTGLSVPDRDVKIALSQISGFLALSFYRDIPEKLPRLRWLQGGMLITLSDWMNHLKMSDSLPRIR